MPILFIMSSLSLFYMKFLLLSIVLFHHFISNAQVPYFPDSAWQIKSAAQLKINEHLIDSAIHFAIQNESKTNFDLRIACLKAYANEQVWRQRLPGKSAVDFTGMGE